jgi:hypothetical protein
MAKKKKKQAKSKRKWHWFVEEEIATRLAWIEKNLPTRSRWKKYDYVDFYDRDVVFLLELVARQQRSLDYLEKANLAYELRERDYYALFGELIDWTEQNGMDEHPFFSSLISRIAMVGAEGPSKSPPRPEV